MILLITMFTNRDYYSTMSSKPNFIVLLSDSETESSTPVVPTLAPMTVSPTTDKNKESQQSSTSPQASSGPIRRSKQTSPFQPYEPATAGKALSYAEEKDIWNDTKWKKEIAPTAEPVILPSIFYQQTTTVPVTINSPPPVKTSSAPLSYQPRNYQIRPTSSDPYYYARTNHKARKRVNARKWSFLLPILKYWRSQEGTPTNRELGERSSFVASKILPVTGEPIHHTIPLLAARLVRHEDRLDAIATLVNNIPNELIEVMSAEIEQLVMGHLEMGTMIEQLSTQFGEAMEFIGLLCSANTVNKDIMCDIDQALDTTRAQVMSLRRAQQETQARERDRDQIIETMAAKIQELERRLDDNQGKP